ncbi:sulfite exporter TauE/SafE family protein [Devosia aurantiaca]|uniref:Probable membrane transporter protein n=1 Tax=Devosia aurantiaca TaxID=2714858 RepID=A0A6M1SLJ3_9HYPH|nr:sulfite exporter TauE/SafE family protein [Devosia aurantiaca]NGP17416.1 sulfite exporter TauE/SafE family protein [Devosia aurantiaca]
MSGLIIPALVALAVFLTSTLSGVFGMAGGLILLALLLTFLPVATAIALQGAIQIIANGSRAWFSRSYIDWRALGFICTGLAAAAILLFILRYTPDLATVCIAIGLMPILVWIPKHWLSLDATKPVHAFFCGFLAGGLNLAVGVSGPTVDIFFIRTEMDRRKVIATKAATQVISHAVKVVFYSTLATAMAWGDWVMVLIAAPFAVAGTNLGYHLLQRLTDVGFRKWTRWIVTVIGAYYLLRGLSLLAGMQ